MNSQWDRDTVVPFSVVPAGTAAFRAGPAGLTFGNFAFVIDGGDVASNEKPPDGVPFTVGLVGLPGYPDIGIGCRDIRPGTPVTLWAGGAFYCRFDAGAIPGARVYADADGKPVSGSIAGSAATPWYVVTPCGAGELALISTTTRVQ